MFGIRLGRRLRYLAPCGLTFPLLLAAEGRAELAEGCVALGEAMVEHSCFHSTFGPFVSVPGTPGESVTSETPNVDAVHTEYRVGLPVVGEVHVITYAPERTGNWALFTATDIELELIDEAGDALPLIFEQRGDTGCDTLPIARVFSLKAKKRYTLRLGPTDVTSEVVVIEYADDFLVRVGRDQDGDGFGSTVDAFVTNCSPPSGFAPNTSDCDDTNPAVNPRAVERCDEVDENCNGSPDDVGLQCRAGAGACSVVGQFTCDGEAATCNAAPVEPEPESCNGVDDDCDGVVDNDGDALCEEAGKPRCVRQDLTAFCGCLLDIDCGDLESGRVCNIEGHRCVEGCSIDPGGNGCPQGEVCEVEGGLSHGICVRQEPEERPDEQVQQRGIGTTNDKDGCQCAFGPSSSRRWLPLALLAVFVAMWRRRRGTRLPLASSLLLCVHCGGKTVENEAQTLDPSVRCTHQVGTKPISHACTHTTNGPFVNVVAAESDGEAPKVDSIHVSYLVELSEEMGKGLVVFTPSRDGEHLLLLDDQVRLTVSRASELVQPLFNDTLHGCETVSYGEVYDFSAGEPYVIAFEPNGHSPALLFFEHLATFGNGAWQERCPEHE